MAISFVVFDWPRCAVQIGRLFFASGKFNSEQMNSSNVRMFHHFSLCICVTVPTGSLNGVWLPLSWLASRSAGLNSLDAASEHLIGGCSAT